ncbi:hypothetical protein SAMN05444411_1257 [Lutibacter oricola]|uniref:Uncharacterized protein n=1 Tax=Lutibacter oricola TaxID=762486 RepID=A0A1H3H415_9FLAO|nr:hypothetical protein [Lutibacter oricola]SDY10252.1 hypothetical protein SAMN05444411_1257 [Lutibacter oricola]
MKENLEDLLNELNNEGDELIKSGKELLETLMTTEYSIFCTSILNRTINLNRGYISLVKDSNYITAAPLVRLNLDSLLRLFASTQCEYHYEKFAEKVRKGEKISMMYDFNKKKQLRDSELVKRLKKIKGFKWTNEIYKIGSGYVHLSNQHLYSSFRFEDKETLVGGIRKNDEFVPEKEKIAGTHYMILASKGIRIFIDDWIKNFNEKK